MLQFVNAALLVEQPIFVTMCEAPLMVLRHCAARARAEGGGAAHANPKRARVQNRDCAVSRRVRPERNVTWSVYRQFPSLNSTPLHHASCLVELSGGPAITSGNGMRRTSSGRSIKAEGRRTSALAGLQKDIS